MACSYAMAQAQAQAHAHPFKKTSDGDTLLITPLGGKVLKFLLATITKYSNTRCA